MGVPRRDHWQRVTAGLDPDRDHERIVRIVAQHEFPWDVQQALSFALFRTYAVPSIGRLLATTGEFTADTQRRHDDTVLILDAVTDSGMDSADGRAAIRRMNQMHGRYPIGNDDMRYVLATFVVTPVRWLDAYGWRRLSETERVAQVCYYQRLGELMGIRDIPADYAAFSDLLDAYEAEHVRFDPGGAAVAAATLRLFGTFYPVPLRPLVRRFAVAVLDEHLRAPLGFGPPSPWFETLSHAALRWRGRMVRWLPPRRRPHRARDLRRVRSYPGGYLIGRLGTFGPDDLARSTPSG